MADNVLQIEIQDKGAPAPSAAAAPPRAPALPAESVSPRSARPAASSSAPMVQPVATAAKEKPGSIVDEVLSHLGYGRQAEAFRELFDYFTKKPQAPAAPAAKTIATPAPAPAAPVAQQAAAPSAATQPIATPPPEQAAGAGFKGFFDIGPNAVMDSLVRDLFERFQSGKGPAVRGELENKLEKAWKDGVATTFESLREIARALLQKGAGRPLQSTTTAPVHAPAQPDLRPNPDLDEVFGKAPKPAPPAIAPVQPMPSAAKQAPKPPALPAVPARPAAAPAAAANAGEAAAAGAEAAGGALAGVAAAALPIGAAFVAVETSIQLTKTAFAEAREAVEVFGHQMSDMAGNNYLGMFDRSLRTTEKTLSKIPITGGMLSSAFGAAVAPVRAFTEVTEAFTKRAHELNAYSPAIAIAEQRSEIRSLFDDLKEANTLGDDMARMLNAETRLQHEMRELLLPLKKLSGEFIADVLEKLADVVQTIKGIADKMGVVVEKSSAIATGVAVVDPRFAAVAVLLDRLRGATEQVARNTQKDDLEDGDPFLRDLLDERQRMWIPQGDAAPMDPRPNIPAVNPFPGL